MVAQWCPSLCGPMDCSPPGSSVHGIIQARILEWVTIFSSRWCSPARDPTCVSWFDRWFLYHWVTWKPYNVGIIFSFSSLLLLLLIFLSVFICLCVIASQIITKATPWSKENLINIYYFNIKNRPGGSDSEASVHNAGDPGLIPGSGRSPGEGNGNPLQ